MCVCMGCMYYSRLYVRIMCAFGTGAVLRNVPLDQLRRVPRTTLVGWAFVALFLAVCAVSIGLSLSVIQHSLDPAKHGVWMFPDHPVRVRTDNDNIMTIPLYNLTYGQVGGDNSNLKPNPLTRIL